MNKEKLKVKIFLILSLVFAILTLIGGYLVVTHKLDNAGYSVIPMLFTLIFRQIPILFIQLPTTAPPATPKHIPKLIPIAI